MKQFKEKVVKKQNMVKERTSSSPHSPNIVYLLGAVFHSTSCSELRPTLKSGRGGATDISLPIKQCCRKEGFSKSWQVWAQNGGCIGTGKGPK